MDKSLLRLSMIGGLFVGVLLVWWPVEAECNCLTVSFLDVGQGDAIYLQTPDGFDVLIDGGSDAGVLRELGNEMSFFDREIDLMMATHPDLDHIGGLSDVLDRYKVRNILMTTNENDTPAAAAFATSLTEEGATVIEAEAGQEIKLGAYVTIQVLSPTGDETNWESNNASIVARVVYGDTAMMFSGDASLEIEEYLVNLYGTQLKSDVLKLGHHGSKTSTSEAWLDAVMPQYAVVSAGLDNRYGHPHQEVMSRVFARNIQSSHTGTDGTVTFYSDGQTVRPK